MVSFPKIYSIFSGEDVDYGEEGFEISASGQNAEDDKFDQIVGALQDILLDEKFSQMTKDFAIKYCMEFEATEENKLCYTSIFKEYQNEIEGYLMKRLAEECPSFDEAYFSNELQSRKDEIDE